ncbi:MAG: ribosome biogenesis GTP-binding protein YihA/YsxC [Bacteroidota bacterium]
MNPKRAEDFHVKASYLSSGVRLDQLPAADRPEFALIGRSNVGKSSLINRLAQHQGLAKSSASPGKTRLINHFLFDIPPAVSLYLVDLPGYGYARASKKEIETWNLMMKRYLKERPNLVCVLQLIDSRLSPQKPI